MRLSQFRIQVLSTSTWWGPVRWFVLGVASVIGFAAALVPQTPTAFATSPVSAPIVPKAETRGDPPHAVPPNPDLPSPTSPVAEMPRAADSADDSGDEANANGRGTGDGGDPIVRRRGNNHAEIAALGQDRKFDSFEQFIKDAPWLAGLVLVTVLLVLILPLLIGVLLFWYKMRKNRMANETLLKLAERGLAPSFAGVDAVASGNTAAFAEAASAPRGNAPVYEHVPPVQRGAMWSDMRKAVTLSCVGLGLTAYSILDDGSPTGIGPVFLFVGLSYGLLWFLENRARRRQNEPMNVPPVGGV